MRVDKFLHSPEQLAHTPFQLPEANSQKSVPQYISYFNPLWSVDFLDFLPPTQLLLAVSKRRLCAQEHMHRPLFPRTHQFFPQEPAGDALVEG
jgi:hypothetical protein